MRKLYFVCFALILSIAMILPVTLPVGASPNENQPVSWVVSSNNENHFYLPDGHGGHVIFVKLLSNETTVGRVKIFDRVTHMVLVSTGFDQTPGATRFWEEDGAKVAEFVAFVEANEFAQFPYNYLVKVKYQIWDYDEPGRQDYHLVWGSFGGDFLEPPLRYDYSAGQAQVHIGN